MTLIGEYHSNPAAAREAAIGDLAPRHHLFDRDDWFALLHRHVAPDREALTLSAADGGATLSLRLLRDTLAPFDRRLPGTITSLAHWYSFAWRPIWTGAPDAAARRRMAREVAATIKGQAHHAVLCPVPSDDGSADVLADGLRAAGWTVSVEPTSHNHWLDTQGRSFAEWWAERPGALRSTVKRKGAKGLVAIDILDHFDPAAWSAFEQVYAQSWKPAESHPALLREWAEAQGAAGTLRLGIARIDGEPVAAQFWTLDDGVAYIHKLAHVQGHDALSPGTLLSHALFRHAFEAGATRIDFGTGDDAYKRDWMESAAPLMTITALDPHAPRAWPLLLRRLAKRVASRPPSR